jgi:hypothetical protein
MGPWAVGTCVKSGVPLKDAQNEFWAPLGVVWEDRV